MSVEQYDRLIHEMETHHQGAHNAGRPMLLEGGGPESNGFLPLRYGISKKQRGGRPRDWMQALDGAPGLLELQVAQLSESFGPGLFRNFVSLFNVSRMLRWAGGVCQVKHSLRIG